MSNTRTQQSRDDQAARKSAENESRPALEVADFFRDRGPAWRKAHAGHVSLDQLKLMSAIQQSGLLFDDLVGCFKQRCFDSEI